MSFLYQIFISLFSISLRLASVFHPKAKKFISGRRNVWKKLSSLKETEQKKVWIHCASLGEFEQARPLIEELKSKDNSLFILLTFFSPSGYEVQKHYPLADLVSYLPVDTLKNASRFLELGEFSAIFIVKYEFWFNYLSAIKKKQIPTYLISGIFWKNQQFFQWYGKWFAKKLSAFNYFFVQDSTSQQLLETIGYKNTCISGDSRFDRVYKLSQTAYHSAKIEEFVDQKKAIVFGSAWEKEIAFAKELSKKHSELKIIIAPHEIEEEKIQLLQSQFNFCIRLSKIQEGEDLKAKNILIIDSIGLLSKIYRYAHLAIIGGGFGKGIHNTIEAAVYGMPVVFGPNYKKFKEAIELIHCGAGFCVKHKIDFLALVEHFMENNSALEKASEQALEYVKTQVGATQTIIKHLERERILS